MGIFQQFPYSNFHEFNLDQIIKIMREMQDEWTATKAEWASYKEFIDNYFANLDLDEETEKALRVLISDGTLSPVIDPVIIDAVTEWLAEHITQPTTPVVDTSLSIAGAAADAKTVGDLISGYDDTARLIWTAGKFWYDNSGVIGFSNYAQTSAANRIRVFNGDSYRMRVRGTGTAASYYLTDSAGNILESGPTSQYDGIYTVNNASAYYLHLNNLTTETNTFCYMVRKFNEVEWALEGDKAKQQGIEVAPPVAVTNSAIYDTTGYYSTNSGTTQMASPDFIRLHKGVTYKVITSKPNLMFNLYFYDDDMTYITSYDTNANMKYYQITFTNTSYGFMRIGAYLAGISADDFKLFRIYAYSNTKKISFLGDSITAGVSSSMLYHMYLGHKTGWTCLNYGVGGTGFVGSVSGSNMEGRGVEGRGSMQTSSGNNNILDRTVDIPLDSDGVVVFGGTNDYGGNQTMASFESNVAATIDYFQTNMPTAELIFLTPCRRFSNGNSGETPNTQGLKLSDYCNKIKEICSEKGVKCIDLYNESGLNPSNTTQIATLMPGGLHPNPAGHKFIYQAIADTCISKFSD